MCEPLQPMFNYKASLSEALCLDTKERSYSYSKAGAEMLAPVLLNKLGTHEHACLHTYSMQTHTHTRTCTQTRTNTHTQFTIHTTVTTDEYVL